MRFGDVTDPVDHQGVVDALRKAYLPCDTIMPEEYRRLLAKLN